MKHTYRKMVSNVAKTDFYSGKTYKNKDGVVQDYIKGTYLNHSTGLREKITDKPNKYNREILAKLNELNKEFYALIVSFSIAARLLESHRSEIYGTINNIYRLMKAQSGTIKYNKLLKSKIAVYGITKKRILESLSEDIDKQRDRISRNKDFLRETLEECGLMRVVELVEAESGNAIFDDIVKFIDTSLAGRVFLSEEDRHAFRDEIELHYIEYMKQVADRHGIEMYGDIQNKLLDSIKRRRELAIASSDARREQRKFEERQRKLERLTRDNVAIQNEYDSLSDIVEGVREGLKIPASRASSMAEQMRGLERVFYIGMISGSSVRYYLGEEKLETRSISNARKFTEEQEARKTANELMGMEAYKNTVIDVLSIRATASAEVQQAGLQFGRGMDTRTAETITRNGLSTVLDGLDTDESIGLLVNVMRVLNGCVCEPESYRGTFYVYFTDSGVGLKRLLARNERGKLYISEYMSRNLVLSRTRGKHVKTTIDGTEVCFRPIEIRFECSWVRDYLELIYRENKLLQRSIDAGKALNLKLGHCMFSDRNNDKKIAKLISMYEQPCKVYYIARIRVGGKRWSHILDIVRYVRMSNRSGSSESIANADKFESLQMALDTCQRLSMSNEFEIYSIHELNLGGYSAEQNS